MANSNEHEERVPFSDPMFNRGYEIVKSHEPDNDDFDYEDEENSKNIIKPIVSVIAVGVIGYFGFNYLQQDTKKNITQPNITKEITDTQTVKEDININNEEKEIIESVIEEKKEPQTTPTPIVEKVEKKVVKEEKVQEKVVEEEKVQEKVVEEAKVVKKEKVEEKVEKVKEKATAIEKTEPKVISTPTPVTKEVSKIENIDEMKAKVIKTLVQKSKHKERTKKVEKPKKPQYRVVTVRKGDTLASISKRFYGNPMKFKRIIRANRDIKSASTQLHLGQKIIVPIIQSKSKKKKVVTKRRMVTVRKGDTLAIIAKRFYGDSSKYKKIVNANYKIKNEHTPLHIGQKIYVPR